MIEFKLKPTTLSCHCPVKLLTQYQPCIIVCYSVYFWLIRSFTDPAFTGSIFVCGPLHHHVLLSVKYLDSVEFTLDLTFVFNFFFFWGGWGGFPNDAVVRNVR